MLQPKDNLETEHMPIEYISRLVALSPPDDNIDEILNRIAIIKKAGKNTHSHPERPTESQEKHLGFNDICEDIAENLNLKHEFSKTGHRFESDLIIVPAR